MSFQEFVVEYYGWVLAILLILIVTIIGFIADKKIKKKKEGKKMNEQNIANNQFTPNAADVNAMPNTAASPIMDPNQGQSMAMPNMSAFNQPQMQPNTPPVMPEQPINNVVNTPEPDNGFFTPLSEQTPNIPPSFDGTIGAQTNMNVNPVNPINTGFEQGMQQVNQVNPMPNNVVPPVMEPNQMATPVMPVENVGYTAPLVNEVQMPPQVEPIQPINPQPMPIGNEFNVEAMPNTNMAMPNVAQPVNPMPQAPQQPVTNINPNAGVDVNNMFVTGNQVPNNNNTTNNPW